MTGGRRGLCESRVPPVSARPRNVGVLACGGETFDEVRKQLDRAVENLECAPESFYFLDAEHSRAEVVAWFQLQAAFADTRPAD